MAGFLSYCSARGLFCSLCMHWGMAEVIRLMLSSQKVRMFKNGRLCGLSILYFMSDMLFARGMSVGACHSMMRGN